MIRKVEQHEKEVDHIYEEFERTTSKEIQQIEKKVRKLEIVLGIVFTFENSLETMQLENHKYRERRRKNSCEPPEEV